VIVIPHLPARRSIGAGGMRDPVNATISFLIPAQQSWVNTSSLPAQALA